MFLYLPTNLHKYQDTYIHTYCTYIHTYMQPRSTYLPFYLPTYFNIPTYFEEVVPIYLPTSNDYRHTYLATELLVLSHCLPTHLPSYRITGFKSLSVILGHHLWQVSSHGLQPDSALTSIHIPVLKPAGAPGGVHPSIIPFLSSHFTSCTPA